MVITIDGKTVELTPGGIVYSEKEDIFKDWSELSHDVQERLEQIRDCIEALVKEGMELIQPG